MTAALAARLADSIVQAEGDVAKGAAQFTGGAAVVICIVVAVVLWLMD